MASIAVDSRAAPSLGLGTCWTGFLQPGSETVRPGFVVGFPEVQFARIPARRPAQVTGQ